MPKVKIFLAKEIYDDYNCQFLLQEGISDWEALSEDDTYFLKLNAWRMFPKTNRTGYTPYIVIQDDQSVISRVESIKAALKKEQDEVQKRQDASKKKEEERKRKSAEKKLAKTETDRKLLYETLKREFENNG